jgi:hypothetical protein
LAAGEIGFETDTGNFKIGNGSTAWASLAYNLNGGVSTSGGSTITVASGTTVPLTIQNNGTGNSFVVNDEASDATPFIIDAIGSVGIGTTTPGARLDLIGPLGSVTAPTYPNQTVLAIRNNFHTRMAFVNANPAVYSSEIFSFGPSAANASQNFSMNPNGFTFSTGNTAGSVALSERMRIDFSGLVGINGAASGTQFQVTNSTAGNIGTIIRGAASQTADLLSIQNSASTVLVEVDSAGNVGIGTTFLGSKLNIFGTVTNQASSLGTQDASTVAIGNAAGSALNIKAKILFGNTDGSTFAYSAVSGYYAAYNGANDIGTGLIFGTQLNAAGGTVERMRIDQSGNVGVGTTAPAAKLDVDGSIRGNNLLLANPLINGAFDFYQRSDAPTTGINTVGGFQYTVDRWISRTGAGGGSMVTSRQVTNDTTNLPFIQYCARVRRSTSNTNTGVLQLQQAIETTNSIPFAGRQVTLSFYARKAAGFTGTFEGILLSGTGTDQSLPVSFTGGATVASAYFTLTTTWTRYTVTGTIGSTATQLGVVMNHIPSGTAGADDYYEVTGVQIDLGSAALPFRRSGGTIQGELSACQRYYWRFTGGNGNFAAYGTGVTGSTTQCDVFVQFPTTMRTRPTTLEFSTLALADGLNTASVSTLTVLRSNEMGATLAAGATGLVQYRPHQLINNNNSTTAFLGVTAEL